MPGQAQRPRPAQPQRTATRPAPRPQPVEEPEQEVEEEAQEQFEEDPFEQQDEYAEGEVTEDSIIDLSDVPEAVERELLRPGLYNGVINEINFGQSNRSGNPMLTWVINVELPEGGGQNVWYHTVMTGDGLSRVKKAINQLLAPDEEFDWTHFSAAAVIEQFTGRDCRVRVRIQNSPEYGKTNSVADLLSPADTGFSQ